MKVRAILGAVALIGCGLSQVAMAKSAAWLRHDREVIRQMNLRELRKVRERDARYAAHNRRARAQQAEYAYRRAAYERDMAAYEQQRRSYNIRLAAWRRDVADCRAGYRSACAR